MCAKQGSWSFGSVAVLSSDEFYPLLQITTVLCFDVQVVQWCLVQMMCFALGKC